MDHPSTVYEDNQACIHFTKNFVCNKRSKHIDIKYHNSRLAQKAGIIKLVYCPTDDMIADLFTKPLPPMKFKQHAKALGVKSVGVSGGESDLKHVHT